MLPGVQRPPRGGAAWPLWGGEASDMGLAWARESRRGFEPRSPLEFILAAGANPPRGSTKDLLSMNRVVTFIGRGA